MTTELEQAERELALQDALIDHCDKMLRGHVDRKRELAARVESLRKAAPWTGWLVFTASGARYSSYEDEAEAKRVASNLKGRAVRITEVPEGWQLVKVPTSNRELEDIMDAAEAECALRTERGTMIYARAILNAALGFGGGK